METQLVSVKKVGEAGEERFSTGFLDLPSVCEDQQSFAPKHIHSNVQPMTIWPQLSEMVEVIEPPLMFHHIRSL